ncbi:MAG: hypothetical protein GVY20_01675 [Bacteroidetes bacterium]|jgi:hypothetical protein|nr:hypothetical protein [Bacteroidota bacterium]
MTDDKPKNNDEVQTDLLGVDSRSFDTKNIYMTQLFEQYKLYVQMSDSHSNRFDSLNKFFLSANLAMISGLLLIISENIDLGVIATIVITFVPIIISFVWWASLKSSKQLTKTKYEVIEEMEEHLPIKPFYFEWHTKLESGKKYRNIQNIIHWIPIFFIFLFLALGLILINKSFLFV